MISRLDNLEKKRCRPTCKIGKLGNVRQGVLSLELAFVLPILLFAFLAIVQFSTYLLATQTIQAAALVGAREATLPGADENSVKGAVERALHGWCFKDDLDDLVIEPTAPVNWKDLPTGSCLCVSVSVDADKACLHPLKGIAGLSLSGKKICGQYIMRKE